MLELLAPELGVALDESVEELPLELLLGAGVDEDEAPLLGVLGEVLEEEELLLGEVVLGGVLGVVLMLPDADPLADPGFLVVVSLEDDPEDEVAPDGEDGVVAPRELSPAPGPRSQP